jgi:hypothetical protein
LELLVFGMRALGSGRDPWRIGVETSPPAKLVPPVDCGTPTNTPWGTREPRVRGGHGRQPERAERICDRVRPELFSHASGMKVRFRRYARLGRRCPRYAASAGGAPRGIAVPRGLLVISRPGGAALVCRRVRNFPFLAAPRPAPGLGAFLLLLEDALAGHRSLRHAGTHPRCRSCLMAGHVYRGRAI